MTTHREISKTPDDNAPDELIIEIPMLSLGIKNGVFRCVKFGRMRTSFMACFSRSRYAVNVKTECNGETTNSTKGAFMANTPQIPIGRGYFTDISVRTMP